MDRDTTAPVVDPERLPVPTRMAGTPLLERWIEQDPKVAMERLDNMVAMLNALTLASIRRTYPTDWLIHTSVDRESGAIIRQVGYLQDCGAERAAKPWGIEVGTPAIETEDFPADGTVAYHMSAEAWSKVTGERIERVEGSRWSGDSFFQRQRKDEDDRVDPTDVCKAAYANLHGRAVRALAGLNAVPLETLKQGGIDVEKVVHIGYQAGARGGESTGAGVGTADAVMGFGNSRGKKPGELDAKDLDWYVGAYQKNVNDPSRKKYQTSNQRILDALLREKERRDQAAAHGEAAGAAEAEKNGKPAEGSAAGEPQKEDARGTLVHNVWALIQGVAGKRAIPLLQKVVAEQFQTKRTGLTDCTDEELRWVASIPEDILKTTLGTLEPGKK